MHQVRRFSIGWLSLILFLAVGVMLQIRALDTHYKTAKPAPGGSYVEGVMGTFTNANPLYASGAADSSVSRLVFAGLLKYDNDSQLVGDLAESWTVDKKFTTYTVKLKPDLYWHDGQPLTAKDVVFTFKLIQNPDARSYLESSWKDIDINQVDDRTIKFTLANKFIAFPHSFTTGIVPKHIIESIPPDQLRSSDFNTIHAIGAGPFKLDDVQVEGESDNREERIGMTPFDRYHDGKPNIDRFVIKTFKDEDKMIAEYEDRQVDAMVGLAALPDQLASDPSTVEYTPQLLGQVMVFYKTTEPPLNDPKIRQALSQAINKRDVLTKVPYPLAAIDGPLLPVHVGYKKSAIAVANIKKADQTLDKLGWKKDPNTGLRTKNGKTLKFNLVSRTNTEYSAIIQGLQEQWRELGVDVTVMLQGEQELQSTVAQHSYDALLYAVSIGPDPDVFAYWHSSQADVRSSTRLNFSEYESAVASQALEAGRTRTDNKTRSVKYQTFAEQWQKDIPALPLYQPRMLYVVREPLYGFNVNTVVTATDRYATVDDWAVRQVKSY